MISMTILFPSKHQKVNYNKYHNIWVCHNIGSWGNKTISDNATKILFSKTCQDKSSNKLSIYFTFCFVFFSRNFKT